MAIAQIQTPQQQVNPLQSILQGTNVISDFLNKAFQASRDNVNNQYRQDQALVQNMQLAQGLAQRRAQDLDQRLIDRRNFDYREQQDAIQLGLRQDQLALQREQNLFNNEGAIGRMNLAVNADQRADRTLALRENELVRDQQFLRDVATPTAENTAVPPTVESLPGSPQEIAPVTAPTDYSVRSVTDRVIGEFNTPTQEPPRATPVVNPADAALTPSRVDLEARKAQLQTGIQAATRLKDANLLRQNQNALAEVNGQLAAIPKPPTNADRRADTRLEMAQDKATQSEATTRMQQMVEGDTAAFVPQIQQYTRRFENYKKDNKDATFDQFKATLPPTELAAAEAYDKNRFESELESARNATSADAYANNIPNPTPAAVKKRKEFWAYANQQQSTSAANPVSDAINKLLGR